jgi:hypothetical protein
MKYSYAERCRIIAEARETLARARMAECLDGLAAERLELQREVADDRAFQRLQLARKRWLADHERRHQNQPLVYKVKWDARIR